MASSEKKKEKVPVACVSCRFWDDHEKDGEGTCRVNPPVMFYTGEHQRQDPHGGVWPLTNAGAWCGSWEAPNGE